MEKNLNTLLLTTALLLAIGFAGCEKTEQPTPAPEPTPVSEPTPDPVKQPSPTVPVGAADASDFPGQGLTSIFREDFPFVSAAGEPSPISVPPTRTDTGVKLLSHGSDSLAWRLNLLGRARESIRVQTYIYTADEAGKAISKKLKKARKVGLDVRLTIDCYNKFSPADRLLYNDFELSGIKVMGFEPAYLLGVKENAKLSFSDVNMRFHEKYFVIDEQIAIVGGTNVANEYYRHGDDPADQWRDQDVLLTGMIARDVARAFDDNHEYFKLRRDGRLPTNRAAWFKKAWWEITGAKPPPINLEPKKSTIKIDPAKFDDQDVSVRFLRHRPRHDEDYAFQAYLHLFDHARESIIVENAYFVPNHALLNSLMRAARRGVRVLVLTNSDATNDVKGMQPLSRYSYIGLVENGVEVYEWQGDPKGYGALHSKVAVIDGRVSVIGSCNLDPRSLSINSEDVVLIDSPVIAEKLANYIEGVDVKISERVTREQALEWRRPEGVSDKFSLKFGKAMEDWY